MKVYKFGGASVKSAEAVRNVCKIIQAVKSPLLVVISAMGKTTNALEDIVFASQKDQNFAHRLAELKSFHDRIVDELFPDPTEVKSKVKQQMDRIPGELANGPDIDLLYDQVVSAGEIISTVIVADYLSTLIPAKWIDAREFIVTDNTYREGKVNWFKTKEKIQSLKAVLETTPIITQGFIGKGEGSYTTTLGREGSDYSAAIFASCLGAESVTIWKDVPGVMNADPKRLPAAVIFEELPFQEAAEMTYYGASVIHPKTIKPLANANIPLYVKNFDDVSLPGTRIHECKIEGIAPLIVFKDNQCLISCKVTDYTFVSEDQLSTIFKTLADHQVKINMMQNSAISFSFCADYREPKIRGLIESLSKTFEVYYNINLTLITIKNHTTQLLTEYRSKPGIVLEQISRSTLQLLIKESGSSSGKK